MDEVQAFFQGEVLFPPPTKVIIVQPLPPAQPYLSPVLDELADYVNKEVPPPQRFMQKLKDFTTSSENRLGLLSGGIVDILCRGSRDTFLSVWTMFKSTDAGGDHAMIFAIKAAMNEICPMRDECVDRVCCSFLLSLRPRLTSSSLKMHNVAYFCHQCIRRTL